MRLKAYQWGELLGILFVLASTATQIFYVEPLKREIEWRMAAFNMQQNGQLQVQAIYASRIALTRAMRSGEDEIKAAEAERDAVVAKYKSADANISDFLHDKEAIESTLQIAVLVLFAIGSLLAGAGRALEMIAAHRVGSRE